MITKYAVALECGNKTYYLDYRNKLTQDPIKYNWTSCNASSKQWKTKQGADKYVRIILGLYPELLGTVHSVEQLIPETIEEANELY